MTFQTATACLTNLCRLCQAPSAAHIFSFAYGNAALLCWLDDSSASLPLWQCPCQLQRLGRSAQVTTSSFTSTFNMDSAGALYYIITNLPAPSVPVQPGTAVLASGGFGEPELLPAPAADSYTVESVTVRGEDATVDVHIPTGRRLSSDNSAHIKELTPWHGATSHGQAEWTSTLSHRSASCQSVPLPRTGCMEFVPTGLLIFGAPFPLKAALATLL